MADGSLIRSMALRFEHAAALSLDSTPAKPAPLERAITDLFIRSRYQVFAKVLPFDSPCLVAWPMADDLITRLAEERSQAARALDFLFETMDQWTPDDTDSAAARVKSALVTIKGDGDPIIHQLSDAGGRVIRGHRDAVVSRDDEARECDVRDIRIDMAQKTMSAAVDGRRGVFPLSLKGLTTEAVEHLDRLSVPLALDSIRVKVVTRSKGRPYVRAQALSEALLAAGIR